MPWGWPPRESSIAGYHVRGIEQKWFEAFTVHSEQADWAGTDQLKVLSGPTRVIGTPSAKGRDHDGPTATRLGYYMDE